MIAVVVGTIGIVAITVVIGVVLDRKLGLLPRPAELKVTARPAPAHAPGEAPATAIRTTAARLASLRASQRCTACRAPAIASSDEHVRYGDRELVVMRVRCTLCDESRALYVDPT